MGSIDDEAAFAAEIHQRLLAGDPVATSDLYAHYAQRLYRQLRSKWPGVDDEMVQDAVTDALLDYGGRPGQFNPSRGSLLGFLLMAAKGDLGNKYQQEKRQRARIVHLEPVENDEAPGNMELGRTEDFVDAFIDQQVAAADTAWALALCETDKERIVAQLMIDGEKQTAVFAAALGLADQPPSAQQATVLRLKDRIKKRWQRAFEDFRHA